ncbi:type III pantothenate kinase [Andreprevotia lacus DSM 23236]|jgi:type III pantothenate kinase|uniref:Type III pantothenate kinase n=1 Tax=Andreprevotia lacus DSM 23236 TaxID=1121001 RepID=A0A1W1XXI9_9NEIS|nr:type III pantothenate kinase [Andreprevotia lacus]SMC28585.1 type III pantothenate kinase [Andreprevotia lacus DSM 23236]
MSTRLLLDLGNTRLKWALESGAQRLADGDALHAELPTLAARFASLPAPDGIFGCTVAAPALREQLDVLCLRAWQQKPRWLQVSKEALGIRNRYRRIEQQGPDRWAAVLGASQRHPAQALVIASAGTALTVDSVTADGTFLGGMILPGYRLMKTALAQGTARLPDAAGSLHDFPTSTEDAIETGVLTALAGTVDTAMRRLGARGEEPLLLLAGGDAERIAPLLVSPHRIEPDLVLCGLAALAVAKEFTP